MTKSLVIATVLLLAGVISLGVYAEKHLNPAFRAVLNGQLSSGTSNPSGPCTTPNAFISTGDGTTWWCNAGTWTEANVMANAPIYCVSGSIGGSVLTLGIPSKTVVSCPGALPNMAVSITPQSDPGSVQWQAFSGTNQVTISLTSYILSITPASTTYNIAVFPHP